MDSASRESAQQVVSAMLEQLDSDILYDLYGDHSQVTIHRDGSATIDDYEHD